MRNIIGFILAFIALCSVSSCSKKNSGNPVSPHDSVAKQDTIYYPSYQGAVLDSEFSGGVKLGTLDPVTLKEASGLAASRKYPNFFWTHNDSGNPNDIYLIDSTGKIRAIVIIANGSNVDWEDIAVAPGPAPGVSYIYVGDIGDNKGDHFASTIYRFPEPDLVISDSAVVHQSVYNSSRIFLQYPNGAHNAETLMVDPLTKDIYIASKGAISFLYEAPYPQSLDSTFTMKEVAVLPLSTLTAGDISSAGDEILMKNYEQIYYWKRIPGEKIVQTLLRTPYTLPYIVEAQGEAICWSISADAYYTTSEYANNIVAPLYKYKRK